MGVGADFPAAFAKASWGAGDRLPLDGTVFVSVADAEKDAVILMALMLSTLGFKILATEGTHRALNLNGIDSELVLKHTVGMELRAAREAGTPATAALEAGASTQLADGVGTAGYAGGPITTVVDLIEEGQVDLVINIPRGRGARSDGYEIRRAALRRGVPTMTNAAAAHAAVQAIASARRNREVTVACLQDLHHRLAASAGSQGLRQEVAELLRESAGGHRVGSASSPSDSRPQEKSRVMNAASGVTPGKAGRHGSGGGSGRVLGRVTKNDPRGNLFWLTVGVPDWIGARPGQFALLQAEPSCSFLSRALSVADEEKGGVSFLIDPVGEGTRELCSLGPGDPVWVLGPLGNGFELEEIVSFGSPAGPNRDLHREDRVACWSSPAG